MSVPALVLSGLSKSFGGVPAVRDASLCVAQGERRLLLGPNGAGKTTLFNLVTGDLSPDAGSIQLFGREISRLSPPHHVHLGLSRNSQVITLFPQNTLSHNIALALLGRSPARWNPFAGLAGLRSVWSRAHEVLGRGGLAASAGKRLSKTSYGEQRRVEIAMALAQEPRLLLLDEPFAGLSREERRDTQAQLAAIPRDVTVILIEHDLDVALAFAERITVLHQGGVLCEGTRAEVVADARVQEVYLGG
ncbi:MAG: ABC transporter ATP-binding protein [Myxococcales bacterium]